MRIDIRLPLGLLFLVFGAVLAVFGLAGDPAIYARSLGVNVNLWWGTVMFAFGLIMFVLGRRRHRQLSQPAEAAGVQSKAQSSTDKR